MLDYASVRRPPTHQRHPLLLGLILAGHAAALYAVISAKMDLPTPWRATTTIVDNIPLDTDPPPPPPPPQPVPSHPQQSPVSSIDTVRTSEPVRLDQGPVVVPAPPGPSVDPAPLNPGPVLTPALPLVPTPVRNGPVSLTSPDDLRPPYPEAMRRLEKEATVALRLGIDERGRVVTVDPVGAAEPAFVDSARRQILSRWRYRPATEDGRPVPTSLVVRLHFQLEDR